MSRILQKWITKLGASLLLASMVLTAFVGHAAFAAGCGTPITGSGSSCTITFVTFNPSGVLSYQSVSSLTVSNADPMTHIGTFSFDSTVGDGRGGTAGWSLSASTMGLTTTGGHPVFPHFNGRDSEGGAPASIITLNPLAGGNCGIPHLFSVTLDSTVPGSTFASADTGTAPIGCVYNITTNGYIDFSGQPAGSYTGDVTITLASV
ncbi:MAG TPA: hypothetical protein VL485_05565 [Ktedonobacteraceae bacterium]|jgi:hypothetical protein|nr:hypothetical protein [Ktedonobacteraceae bacterium]